MRKNQLLICCVLLLCLDVVSAQNKKALALPSKPTVLVDDKHAESLRSAKETFDLQRIAAIKALDGLSASQMRNINCLAEQRVKKLKQIDEQLAAKKEQLATLSAAGNNNAKQIKKATDEISKLAIERQKVSVEAMKKIKSQLTTKQLASLNAAN
jgi:hypothetical protein